MEWRDHELSRVRSALDDAYAVGRERGEEISRLDNELHVAHDALAAANTELEREHVARDGGVVARTRASRTREGPDPAWTGTNIP